MILPRFVGIGAMKAGTSTVHDLLAAHPGVAVPRHRKEVMFFDRHHDRGAAWYASHFEHAGERVPGEITPGYMAHPEAAARIHALLPDARLLVMLRDPIARAVSQYRFYVKENGYRGTVADYLRDHPNAVSRGCYDAQLSPFYDRFPAAHIHVAILERFQRDPVAGMQAIYAHIGVDASFVPEGADTRRNAAAVPRFHRAYTLGRAAVGWLYAHDLGPVVHGLKRLGLKRVFVAPERADASAFHPLTAADRARLLDAYRDDVAALQARLGLDLRADWETAAS